MLYDWANRPMNDADPAKGRPDGRRLVSWEESDRDPTDASRGLSPEKLDGILRQANSGDPRAQARLAQEIEEKDWDSAHALGTRRAAILSAERCCKPPPGFEKDATALKVAEQAEQMLGRTVSGFDQVDFDGLLSDMAGALLPGYSCAEILWTPGGEGVDGFALIDRAMITFQRSRAPLLVSRDAPMGLQLAPKKFVFHAHNARSGDLTRGGLIRPLGWMHLFAQLGVKNVLRFVEKFGMPFVSARIDDSAWEQDRAKIAYLVKNFGSDGGGVFSKAVELEMIDAAGSSGEVYFKLLQYFSDAKTKVILGQTATSGDATGFSDGGAQQRVRFDLRDADCKAIAATVRNSILTPWVAFNFAPGTPVPVVELEFEQAEDLEKKSRVLSNLKTAGLVVSDTKQASEMFGLTLERESAPAGNSFQLAGERSRASARRAAVIASRAANEKVVTSALAKLTGDQALLKDWLGPVLDAFEDALSGPPEGTKARLQNLLQAQPEIFRKMDTRALETHLLEAAIAGDTNGRLAALTGLN